jgi:hypothetical protein
MIYVFDYATLKVIWWGVVGLLLVGFAILDGFDLGIGMLLPFVGRTDTERPRDAQFRRADVGRQSGVVHHRGRRDVRRVAARLRYGILRLSTLR